MEWLNKYKKIIISFCMSFAILGCSVLTPFMEVGATELEETRIQDLNGDGRITFDEWGEQSISRLSLAFSMIGVCFGNPTSYVALADRVAESQAYQDFLAKNEPAELVVGYLTDDNFFYFSDGTFDMCENFLKETKTSYGFSTYPAFPSDPYFYIENGATVNESITKDFINKFGSYIENNAFVVKDEYGYYRILLPEESISSSTSSYTSDCNDYVYVKLNGKDNYIYIYYLNESGALEYAGYFGSRYYLSPGTIGGFNYKSFSSSTPSFGDGNSLLGFVGNSHIVFDNIESAYAYCSFNRELFESNNTYKYILPLDTLNNTDWEAFNKNTYDSIYNAIIDTKEQNGSLTDSEAQAIIDSYFDQILQQLTENGESQSTWLSKIYALLEKWLPNIGKGGDTNIDVDINTEEDDNKVNDFATNSDGQSNSLDDLNQQTDYEKVDVDSASTEVDENVDLEAVGSYGTLLSSVTSNEYVIYILLATLSIALVSYVLFGKR